jgi:hypothetical protein
VLVEIDQLPTVGEPDRRGVDCHGHSFGLVYGCTLASAEGRGRIRRGTARPGR